MVNKSTISAEPTQGALDNTGPNDEAVVPVNDPVVAKRDNPTGSYEGRKYEPNIDGPEQASQETDEVYADPRKEEDLPAGGKNVADLNAYDLTQKNNSI
mgnify:CR=1 FL=1